jgi:hypothetical protein
MTDILFEPKFKNVYTHTEVIKTDKFIVVIGDDIESSRFNDFLDYYDIECDIDYLEDIWQFSFDLIYLDPIKMLIEKYDIKTLEIK